MIITKQGHGDSRPPMIPSFLVYLVSQLHSPLLWSHSLLSLSSFICIFHFGERGYIIIIIEGTPEENFWFLRGIWFWVIWVFLWVLGNLRGKFWWHTRVVVVPWLGVEILKLGLLLLEVGPMIWNQGGFIKFGGVAMLVLFCSFSFCFNC